MGGIQGPRHDKDGRLLALGTLFNLFEIPCHRHSFPLHASIDCDLVWFTISAVEATAAVDGVSRQRSTVSQRKKREIAFGRIKRNLDKGTRGQLGS
mmetsp:Transcript_26916/g.62371  ORF Transcript_26916/g.62371 Transcript_26916/m.62371 type:complete len:96 (+) Transcript_26916:836-1123(+)